MSARGPNRSLDQWRDLITEYRTSNESDVAFCEQRNLNFHTFRKHKYTLSKTVAPTPAFAEVAVKAAASDPGLPLGLITVHAPGDVRVELPPSMALTAVAQLVHALQHER